MGAAADTNLQQRTVSLSTWMGSTQGTGGASTPEHQGLFSTAAAGSGAGSTGGADATGLSPGHLPSWWTSNTPAQPAGTTKASVLHGSADAQAAAAGNKLQDKASTGQHKQQATLQDASGTPAGSAGTGNGGIATPSAGKAPGGSSVVHGSDGSGSGSPSSACDAVLCLLLRNSITCIFPSGELLECPLLQPCHAMWPLPTGVILAVSTCINKVQSGLKCRPNQMSRSSFPAPLFSATPVMPHTFILIIWCVSSWPCCFQQGVQSVAVGVAPPVSLHCVS